MITPRYQYPEIPRKEKNGVRHYCLPDGNLVPSVTTILGATKSDDSKQALDNWRNRVGHKNAEFITAEAGGRGTRMHAYLEHWILTNELKVPGSNPYAKQSNKMASIVIEKGLCNATEFWGTEVGLYYPGIYAGTTDVVGCWKSHPAIMDFKQTNRPKKTEWINDYFLQLAAYAIAHNKVHGTRIQSGAILMCSQNFEYQEWVIEGAEFDHWVSKWWQRVEEYYLLNT